MQWGGSLKDRYGGLDEIKRTVAEDPVGLAGDVAGLLTGGGTMAVKGAGMAGKAGNIGKTVSKVGRALEPTALAAKAGAKVASKFGGAISQILGISTGASPTPIKVAFASGKAGGRQGKMFVESMRGKIPMDDVVTEARSALTEMHRNKMDSYKKGIAQAFGEGVGEKQIDFSKVLDTAEKSMGTGKFKGVNISESTAAVRQKLKSRLDEWKKLDPAEYHTVEGMDALKKSIGDVLDSSPYGTPERKLANEVHFAVKKAIDAQAPEYAKVMSGYTEASKHLEGPRESAITRSKALLRRRLLGNCRPS